MTTQRRSIYRALARRIAPGIRNSQYAWIDRLREETRGASVWLDVGCGRRLWPSWMELDETDRQAARGGARLVGIDLDLPSLRDNGDHDLAIYGPIDRLPFRDGVFDLVTANMVVEHLEAPETALAEVARVLRPGGRFAFHTPNIRSPIARAASWTPEWIKEPAIRVLEGRRSEDVFPTHYRLNRESSIRRVAEAAGLRVVRVDHVETTPTTSRLGPLSIFELGLARCLRSARFAAFRPDLVAVLEKPESGEAARR